MSACNFCKYNNPKDNKCDIPHDCFDGERFEPIHPAASTWRTDEPPRDGTLILAIVDSYDSHLCRVCSYSGDGDEGGFEDSNDTLIERDDIIAWAEIIPYEVEK